MEHQTRFNLSAALESWREELAAQSNLTAETRRELETHVSDTVAEMQQRGLNDEESFWLARRRVGQPKELVAEFAKADPTNAGRKWVLWIALAFYALALWQEIAGFLWQAIIPRKFYVYPFVQIGHSLTYLFVTLFCIYVAQARSLTKFAAWRSFILSHGRVFVVCLFLADKGFEFAVIAHVAHPEWPGFLYEPSFLTWPLALAVIILWLLPSEKPPTLARA